ncbi:hypothetical protein ACW9HJ_22810 [Nocardia gipuzkoensis]
MHIDDSFPVAEAIELGGRDVPERQWPIAHRVGGESFGNRQWARRWLGDAGVAGPASRRACVT